MHIYLKGYYGYKNFGDELLLFGVIEEIFKHYPVEELVIEVGNTQRMQERIEKNHTFIDQYYQDNHSQVNRSKIHFFSLDTYQHKSLFWKLLQLLPRKWKSYIITLLWLHPYRFSFKVFWGGEVLDEERSFPHNGWNLLLYFRSIIRRNFTLWGGLGAQACLLTRRLTYFLVSRSQFLLLRDKFSFSVCEKILNTITDSNTRYQYHWDFSSTILRYFLSTKREQSRHHPYILINTNTQSLIENIQATIKLLKNTKKKIFFFPCDLWLDQDFFSPLWPQHIPSFKRDMYPLDYTLNFIEKSEAWFWSRLHFLYCYDCFCLPYAALSSNNKIKRNLEV